MTKEKFTRTPPNRSVSSKIDKVQVVCTLSPSVSTVAYELTNALEIQVDKRHKYPWYHKGRW